MHDDTPLPPEFRRTLTPPSGGASRLAAALASAPHARLRRVPAFAFAAALGVAALAAVPALRMHDANLARAALAEDLRAAMADAGRLGPEVRVDGMTVERIAMTDAGIRVYRVEPEAR